MKVLHTTCLHFQCACFFVRIKASLSYSKQAIYETQPWKFQNDTFNSDVWYTSKDTSVYAILLKWPSTNSLVVQAPINSTFESIHLLGCDQELKWQKTDKITIDLNLNDACLTLTKWNWVFEFVNLSIKY